MSSSVNQLFAEALKLSPDEQAELLDRLAGALGAMDDGPDLGPGWDAEVARRVAELDAGRTRLIPADEALANLADHIRARRSAA